MANNIDLGKDKIGGLLLKLALPSITAQLVNALYNIVDRIFIAKIPGIGEMALTGVGVTFPIIMLISAFAALVGAGGAPMVAIRMGEGNFNIAKKILANAFTMLIITALILTTFFLVFGEKILLMFGASEVTVIYGLEYLKIYLIGTIFVQFALGLNPYISAQGFAKTAMATVVIGAIINMILDPIFIFGFDMGVKGAATATVISQFISATWAILFLMSKKNKLRFEMRDMILKKSIIFPVLALGISPFVMQSTESLVMTVLNTSLQYYGGDPAVAVMTVITSTMQFMTMPLSGIAMAGQPIISYNYGARNIERVKLAFKYVVVCATIYTILLWTIVMTFPQIFVNLFLQDQNLMEMCIWAIKIFMGGVFMLGIQFACQQTFLALGQAKISLILALTRKIFLLIPLAIILPFILGDNVFAVFVSEAIADILASTITLITFIVMFKKILNKRRNLE